MTNGCSKRRVFLPRWGGERGGMARGLGWIEPLGEGLSTSVSRSVIRVEAQMLKSSFLVYGK